MDRTSEGRAFRMLTIVDEFTRECLAIDVSRKLTSKDVLEQLSDLFVRRDVRRFPVGRYGACGWAGAGAVWKPVGRVGGGEGVVVGCAAIEVNTMSAPETPPGRAPCDALPSVACGL
jgi:hypothetical protein